MNYKSIVLELIRERPALHEKLRSNSDLLSTMIQWAEELRSSHLEITEQLLSREPLTSRQQASSEAFEIAVQQLQEAMASQEEDHPQ